MDESLALNSLIHNFEEDANLVWDQESAIEMCVMLEQVAPEFGAHVALTGGCLYKSDRRKDVDIMFYRIRQQPSIDEKGLLDALVDRVGMVIENRFGWVVKARFDNKPVDLFFPEENIHQQMITSTCRYRVYPDGSTGRGTIPSVITCPKCYKPMQYTVNDDAWIHPGAPPPPAVVVKEERCSICAKKYGYIEDEYAGEKTRTCPTCWDRVKNTSMGGFNTTGNVGNSTNAVQTITTGGGSLGTTGNNVLYINDLLDYATNVIQVI